MQDTVSKLIVFRVNCHAAIGTGHLRRCMILAREFSSRGGKVVIAVEQSDLSEKIVRGFNDAKVEYVDRDVLLPTCLPTPDCLFIDFPPGPDSVLNRTDSLSQLFTLNEAGCSIISLGHVGRNSHSFRAVFDLYPSQKIYAANYFEGPEYLILRPEFKEEPRDFSKDQCFLISMGGSDPHNLTDDAISQLVGAGYQGKVLIVLGAGYASDREEALKSRVAELGLDADFYRDVNEMRHLMRMATVALVAFGTTAYELMSQRVPTLVFAHYEWQIPSALLFEKLGCCMYLGCATGTCKDQSVASRIKCLLQAPERMASMSRKAREVVDGNGAVRVADLVENMVSSNKNEQLLDVLFVLAHPGDELFGCGGTLLKQVRNNQKVGLVILGDGVSSRQKESDNVASVMADQMSLRAALQAFVEKTDLKTWYYFRFEDNRFDGHNLLDIIKVLEPVFERHKPRVVYTNHPGDLNIDHRRTFEAVATALRPVAGQRLRSLLSVEVPTSTDWGVPGRSFEPNWFEDVSLFLDEKVELLKIYESELKPDPHPRSVGGIRDRALQWGRFCGRDAAEAFVLHRHIECEDE